MKSHLFLFFYLFLFFNILTLIAQEPSAILHLESTAEGALIPRMSESQRDAISIPVEGLIIYQTTHPSGFYYYDGSDWSPVGEGIISGIWQQAGTDMYYNDGNVGIGISNPLERLHLHSGKLLIGDQTTDDLISLRDDGGNPRLRLGTTSSAEGLINAKHGLIFLNDTDDNSSMADFIWGTDGHSGTYSEIMRLTDEGELGIGTMDPGAPLHIDAGDNVESNLFIGRGNLDGRLNIAWNDLNNSGYLSSFSDGNHQKFYIQADPLILEHGNVGIGQTSPTAKLHIGGTAGVDGIRYPDGSLQTSAASGDGHSLDASDGSPIDALFVNFAGNVGLGTSTPSSKLHINAGSLGGAVIEFTDDNNYGQLVFQGPSDIAFLGKYGNSSSGSIAGIPVASAFRLSSGNGNGPLIIQTGTSLSTNDIHLVTGAYSRMTVDGATGNVGLGTAIPASRLHVNGGKMIIGNINADDLISFRDVSSNTRLRLGVTASALGLINTSHGMLNLTDTDDNSTTADFIWGTNGHSGTYSELMRLTDEGTLQFAAGKVIVGDQTIDDLITLRDGGGNPRLKLGATSSSEGLVNTAHGMLFLTDTDNNSSTSNFIWGTDGGSASYSELVRLTDEGFLAIGTASPTATLHTKASPGENLFRAEHSNGTVMFEVNDYGNSGILSSYNNISFNVRCNSFNDVIFQVEKNDGSAAFNVDDNGDICYYGNLNSCSDIRFKTNLEPLTGVIDRIRGIMTYRYNWRQEDYPDKGFDDEYHIGILAQEMEVVYPEIVHIDKQGFQSVDYTKLSPILLAAIQEQQLIINDQQIEIEQLNARLDKIESLLESLFK